MRAYVLAAGYATRMYPLTRNRPKPLLEVGGRPVLSRILDRLVALPTLEEVVVVGNESFAGHFARWKESYRSPVAIRLLNDGSTHEGDRLGAIGDLAFALDRVPNDGKDLLVVAGDNLIEFDLRPLFARFLAQGTTLLTLRRVPLAGGPSPYNEVEIDSQGRVLRFREKPAHPVSDLAAISLYFFPPEIPEKLREYLASGGKRDQPGHFIAWLVERVPVAGTPLPGEWFDIGSLGTLAEARARFEE